MIPRVSGLNNGRAIARIYDLKQRVNLMAISIANRTVQGLSKKELTQLKMFADKSNDTLLSNIVAGKLNTYF